MPGFTDWQAPALKSRSGAFAHRSLLLCSSHVTLAVIGASSYFEKSGGIGRDNAGRALPLSRPSPVMRRHAVRCGESRLKQPLASNK
ncbi:hypothetical protein Nham_2083 [Nitrobacter hamburgensis X14]|uniref:Uncharacterized protein n=1 Tax=Nitrobacter hamburgensis (strain DSM 10229 / NCIMB 13809 / X14) TaxID=323097 RepID=Q1QLL7_NITHX|nr:hypothetical protein Nham_2083 [Nitrobacter hamburgensis X14]